MQNYFLYNNFNQSIFIILLIMLNNFLNIPQLNQPPVQGKNVLYLSDLPSNITESDLWLFFESYSEQIVIITVNASARSIESLPSHAPNAKVIFRDFKAADEARKELNLRKIKGKTVRIMWDERDNSLRYNTQSNIFVKNIPLAVKPRDVYEYFLQFGDIASAKINEDEDGNHLGYGYISFYDPESSVNAINSTDGQEVWGSHLEVKTFQKKNERISSLSLSANQIYINNFPGNFTENEIRELCQPYGDIVSCKIFIDSTGRNFAIVSYKMEESVPIAKNSLNGRNIDGYELLVDVLQNKFERKQVLSNKIREQNYRLNEQYKYCNLHIRNIPYHAKEEDLIEGFKVYGNIKSVKIEKYLLVTKENNEFKEIPTSKGFGYVCFEDPESAAKAKEALNGKFLPKFESWNRPLLIEYFMPKSERNVIVNKIGNYNAYGLGNMLTQAPQVQPQVAPGSGPQRVQQGYVVPTGRGLNQGVYQIPQMSQQKVNNQNQKYSKGYQNPQMMANPKIGNWNMANMSSANTASNMGAMSNLTNMVNMNNLTGMNMNMNIGMNINPNLQNTQSNAKQMNIRTKNDDIDMNYLNSIEDDNQKKDYLGEIIFKKIENHKISQTHNITIDTIGRITGMILGIDDLNEILDICRNSENLTLRITEALELLYGSSR